MKRVGWFAIPVVLAFIAWRWLIPEPKPAPPPIVEKKETLPSGEKVIRRTNTDGQEVFRRAFWREPTADDRILHAERREWISSVNGVRQWQWFLAVQPSAAFSKWLQEDNPLSVSKVESVSFKKDQPSPDWFPTESLLKNCDIRQSGSQGLTLIFDPAKKILYATDAGNGFAVTDAK